METEAPKPGTAIATAEHFPQVPAEWGGGLNLGQWLTSYDVRKPLEKRALLNAINDDGEDPAGYINTVIELAHVVILPIVFTGEDGEEVKTTRVLLVTGDGHKLDFKSAGILKSLYLIINLERQPPWDPPLKVKLSRIPLKAGKSMYRINLAEDSPLPAKGKR